MRLGIFVDVYSLWLGVRRFNGFTGAQVRVDYGRLLDYLANDREVISADAYVLAKPGTEPPWAFVRALGHLGYQVTQAGDVPHRRIAADLLAHSRDWDIAILAAQEGQYDSAFRELLRRGKSVEVYSFPVGEPLVPGLAIHPLGEEIIAKTTARRTS